MAGVCLSVLSVCLRSQQAKFSCFPPKVGKEKKLMHAAMPCCKLPKKRHGKDRSYHVLALPACFVVEACVVLHKARQEGVREEGSVWVEGRGGSAGRRVCGGGGWCFYGK